ncbi:MAG: hypothetical protein M3Z05_21175 [Gemmatimonadota bacterium]|nr:hypothetical protein [Gemmatimonadota bacterium]
MGTGSAAEAGIFARSGTTGAEGTAVICSAGVGCAVNGFGGVAGALACAGVADAGICVLPLAPLAENSSCDAALASIVMTAPHTEHRARTLETGSRAGSTRNTERHS